MYTWTTPCTSIQVDQHITVYTDHTMYQYTGRSENQFINGLHNVLINR